MTPTIVLDNGRVRYVVVARWGRSSSRPCWSSGGDRLQARSPTAVSAPRVPAVDAGSAHRRAVIRKTCSASCASGVQRAAEPVPAGCGAADRARSGVRRVARRHGPAPRRRSPGLLSGLAGRRGHASRSPAARARFAADSRSRVAMIATTGASAESPAWPRAARPRPSRPNPCHRQVVRCAQAVQLVERQQHRLRAVAGATRPAGADGSLCARALGSHGLVHDSRQLAANSASDSSSLLGAPAMYTANVPGRCPPSRRRSRGRRRGRAAQEQPAS